MQFIIIGIIICFFLVLIPLSFKAMPVYSGWNQLTEEYINSDEISGTEFSYESAMMKSQFSYNGSLKFIVNRNGLGISVLKFFKSFHKNIFIPWDDITAHRDKVLFRSYIKLTLSKVDIPIRISESLANKIQNTLSTFGKELIVH